jgi:hypothetical protein
MRRLASLFAFLFVFALGSSARAQDDEIPTHPDEGLMIAGGVVFGAAVLSGLAILMPIEMSNCIDPGSAHALMLPPDNGYASCSQAPYSGIPFAHVAGGGVDSIIAGPILLVAEIVGLFTFIGGAAHHRPDANTITLTGVSGADVGLGVGVSF